MRLLLDTHVVLWWLAGDPTLSVQAADAIRDEREVYVSSATVWEIEIKRALGKLDAPDDLIAVLTASAFQELAVRWNHARMAAALPRHHSDPFDRMLVAQAQTEGLTVVTADARLSDYAVALLAAGQ